MKKREREEGIRGKGEVQGVVERSETGGTGKEWEKMRERGRKGEAKVRDKRCFSGERKNEAKDEGREVKRNNKSAILNT